MKLKILLDKIIIVISTFTLPIVTYDNLGKGENLCLTKILQTTIDVAIDKCQNKLWNQQLINVYKKIFIMRFHMCDNL